MWAEAVIFVVALWLYYMTVGACLGWALGGPRVTLGHLVRAWYRCQRSSRRSASPHA